MHPVTFTITISLTVITCVQTYMLIPSENAFGGPWTNEKRSEEQEEAIRSIRSPLGTMRFGKRKVTPLGTMRFGKRSDLEHCLNALAMVRQDDSDRTNSGGDNGYPYSYDKQTRSALKEKRGSPLGTMRFGK